MLRQETLRSTAEAAPINLIYFKEISPHDPFGYYDILSTEWSRGETFINIEQDIEVHPTCFQEFADCPELWCGYRYPEGPNLVFALGCVRFRKELLRAEPDIWDGMDKNYRNLAIQLFFCLKGRGYHPHLHEPRVIHHHTYKS